MAIKLKSSYEPTLNKSGSTETVRQPVRYLNRADEFEGLRKSRSAQALSLNLPRKDGSRIDL